MAARASTQLAVWGLAALLLGAPLAAQEGGGGSDSLRNEARQLLEADRPAEALALIREWGGDWQQEPVLAVLAARAYAAQENLAWARRTLVTHLERVPDSCTARAELAWLSLSQADYRSALEVLADDHCPQEPLERGRWKLLEAMALQQSKEPGEAAAPLRRALASPALFAEDRALLSFLLPRVWPLRTPAAELTADWRTGWSSNPLLGSPLDPQSSGADYASIKSEANLWGRLHSPSWGPLRLFAEGDGKGQFLTADASRDLSYAGWGLRPGLELLWPSALIRTAYHFDALWLAAPDEWGERSNWFSQAHRGEAELELRGGITAFAGGGRRQFRLMGRSRWEVEVGGGGGGRLGNRLFLMGAMTGRSQWATDRAFDLRGGTALLSLRTALGAGWSVRGMGTLSADYYPQSAGAAAFHSAATRRDFQLRGRLELVSPEFLPGLQAGIRYQPTRRYSTAPLYDFADHSAMVVLTFRGGWDPWLPAAAAGQSSRLPARYGLEGTADGLGERLQELLRQDEEAQRGSSCMN